MQIIGNIRYLKFFFASTYLHKIVGSLCSLRLHLLHLHLLIISNNS